MRFGGCAGSILALLVLAGCPPSGGGGGGGDFNPRPDDAPPAVIVGVSGHCFDDCPEYNPEYLFDRGTLHEMAYVFNDHGLDVLLLPFSDNFYTWVDQDDEVLAAGFLDLVATLEYIEEEWVADYDNPTRVIVAAHSHGTVWAHTALFLQPELPVDLLVDLDGESAGWEGYASFGGDGWEDVIEDYVDEYDPDWPFDISNAANAWNIPGQSSLQDVEDVVPDNVWLNIEVASSSPIIQDGEPNHRLDGSTDDIYRAEFAEDHGGVTWPGSEPIEWVREVVEVAYVWN